MKRITALLLAGTLAVSAAGCGKSEDEEINAEDMTEATYYVPAEELNDVDDDSAEAIGAKAAVAKMMDTFISADMDAIKEVLVDEDEEYFNFEYDDQVEFYKEIFSRITYEMLYVKEHDGVYGVMTKTTAPDMTDIIAEMFVDMIDIENADEPETLAVRAKNMEKLRERLNSEDEPVDTREQTLYIYVEYEDGEFIPRCDMYLVNELTGGYVEISSEIVSSLMETSSEMSAWE
ncbi:MAG: hypothetical protein LUG52_04880 [Clostridia bacterium]|nr:hypothetical protein [Clostridia bacterium]